MENISIKKEKVELNVNKNEVFKLVEGLTFEKRLERFNIGNFEVLCKNICYNPSGVLDKDMYEFIKDLGADGNMHEVMISYDFKLNKSDERRVYVICIEGKHAREDVKSFIEKVFLNEENLDALVSHIDKYYKVHKEIELLNISREPGDIQKENFKRVIISDDLLINQLKEYDKNIIKAEIELDGINYIVANIVDVKKLRPEFTTSTGRSKIANTCLRCGAQIAEEAKQMPENDPLAFRHPVCAMCLELNHLHTYLTQEMGQNYGELDCVIPANSEKIVEIIKHFR